MKIRKRIRQWRRRQEFEAGLEEEIRFHREMAGGAAFGSVAMTLEDSRAVWSFGWIESAMGDIRYALRGFRKSPGFALAVVGTIGAALGLNTTVFTVFNAYVLRPFAVHDPWSLYRFTWMSKNGAGHRFTWAQYQDLASRKNVFSDVIAVEGLQADVEGRTLFGQLVSGNFFTILGAGVAVGRPLVPDDANVPGTGAVMVIGYDAWKNKFGADPGLVGKTVHLRGNAFEVVGIANPGFTGLESFCSYWIPLSMEGLVTDGRDLLAWPQPERLHLDGRLREGVRPEAAKADLIVWSSGLGADLPKEQRPAGVILQSSATSVPLTRDTIMSFITVFTAFGLVLLIACANVSNMMLARALARQREIGIRVSLGAGRARLVLQLLTESLLLAAPAALTGFALSNLTIEGARRLLFATVPAAFSRILVVADLAPDWRVFGFILLASVIATLAFGLAPAIQTTRSRLVEANRGDFSSDYRPARLRSVLLAAQVAVCSLLLIVTAIVLRSQERVSSRTIGLDLNGVWDVKMAEKYQAQAAERLAAMPGVEVVAAAWHAPLYGSDRRIAVTPSGRSAAVRIGYNLVSPGYFPVFRIPIVRGRGFTDAESETAAPVAVVSESAAHRLWPGADAVGQTVVIPRTDGRDPYANRAPEFTEARVIGVSRNALSGYLANSADRDSVMIYFPTHRRAAHNDSVLVRVSGAPGAARQRIAAVLDGIAPSIYDMINPMDDVLAIQIYPFQVTFWITAFLGGLALLMTVSGIYGVMAYLVNQRTKEIGIRVALGAAAGDVVWMVTRQSARLAFLGVATGVALASVIAPVFAHEIEAIHPYDAIAYGSAVLIVMVAAVGASLPPSRKAVRLDPVTALRCD
ncbi:MAG TPA: ABC transporter permease [Bryobacteraceae bacterium]|nr:ABC transporter permease [Bryobacteraceae bacterium]